MSWFDIVHDTGRWLAEGAEDAVDSVLNPSLYRQRRKARKLKRDVREAVELTRAIVEIAKAAGWRCRVCKRSNRAKYCGGCGRKRGQA